MLALEIINNCNFSCYFCAAGYKPEKLQIISLNTIKELSKDIEELGITYIKLTPSRGEIFIHPEIYDILFILTNHPTIKNIHFHTNFEKINFDKLMNSGIDISKLEINISHYGMDGVEEFIFQTNKGEKQYKKVEDNIVKAKELGIKIMLSPRNRLYNYSCPTQPRQVWNEVKGICNNAYVPRILPNGDFAYCTCGPDSSNIDDRHIIGNIYKENFKDMYLGEKRYQFFEKMKTINVPEICKTCTAFTQRDNNPGISAIKNFVKIKGLHDTSNK